MSDTIRRRRQHPAQRRDRFRHAARPPDRPRYRPRHPRRRPDRDRQAPPRHRGPGAPGPLRPRPPPRQHGLSRKRGTRPGGDHRSLPGFPPGPERPARRGVIARQKPDHLVTFFQDKKGARPASTNWQETKKLGRKTPGRPRGSSPYGAADKPRLRKAAYLLVRGKARSALDAFHQLVGEDDSALIRRLQRRWKSDGERYLREAQEPWWEERWAREAEALKEAAPELYSKLKAFAESEGGAEMLAGLLATRSPSSLMSLDIRKLWELVQDYYPSGTRATDLAFDKTFGEWSRFGTPDAVFLRRFAELCLAKADDADRTDTPDGGQA